MTPVRWHPIQAWAPAVDIFEKDHNIVIRAELSGVKKDDIDIDIEDGVLTLKGERRRESEVEEGNAYRLERVYGAFTRSFSLPTTVDPSNVQAAYKDGVLEVTVPKLEAAKPRKVQIQAA